MIGEAGADGRRRGRGRRTRDRRPPTDQGARRRRRPRRAPGRDAGARTQLGAAPVQIIGKLLILYRPASIEDADADGRIQAFRAATSPRRPRPWQRGSVSCRRRAQGRDAGQGNQGRARRARPAPTWWHPRRANRARRRPGGAPAMRQGATPRPRAAAAGAASGEAQRRALRATGPVARTGRRRPAPRLQAAGQGPSAAKYGWPGAGAGSAAKTVRLRARRAAAPRQLGRARAGRAQSRRPRAPARPARPAAAPARQQVQRLTPAGPGTARSAGRRAAPGAAAGVISERHAAARLGAHS